MFSMLHFWKNVAKPPCEFTGRVLMDKKIKTNCRERTPLDDNDAAAWYNVMCGQTKQEEIPSGTLGMIP